MTPSTLASLDAFSPSDLRQHARHFLSFKTVEKPIARRVNIIGRIIYALGWILDEIAAIIVSLFGGTPYVGDSWEPEWKGEEQLTIVVNRTGEVLYISKFMDPYKLSEIEQNIETEACDSTLESFISKYGAKN